MKLNTLLRLDEDRILVEQLRLLLRNVLPAYLPTLFLTIMLVWVLSNASNTVPMLVWGTSLMAFKLAVALHARHCLKPDYKFSKPVRLVWTLIVLNAIDGLIWSGFAWVTLSTSSMTGSILVIATLSGVVGSGMARLSPVLPVFYAFVSVLLLSVGIKAWTLGDPAYAALGGASMFYLILILVMARNSSREVRASINLRFENVALLEKLRIETELAEVAKFEAERANAAKSKFLAAASHDLRQPLHALTLFVAAMEDKVRHPETADMLGNVQRCTTALGSLLQTLLDISKIDAGVIEPKLVDFPLRPLLDRLFEEFSPQVRAAGLVFAVGCPEFTVRSDPALVERILRNLIGNAIRYTPSGRIDLRSRVSADGIAIEVCDTGIGIPADQQENVFEEFVQLGNPERDRSKGLGLGLAIVQRLASLLRTQVTLDSAPGRGSTFSITLPEGNAQSAVKPVPSAESRPNALDSIRVSVIDDEADVRAGMRMLLESWGCQVFVGEDAQAVITALTATGTRPDIIVADYRLRDNTTGVDAIRAMMDHFGAAIPAAIITGDTAPERLIEARASGYQLLHKPLRPAKLRVLLQNLSRSVSVGDRD